MYHPYIIYLIRSVLSWRTRDMQAGHNSNNFEIVCICRLKRMQPLPAVVVRLSVSFAPFYQDPAIWLGARGEGFSKDSLVKWVLGLAHMPPSVLNIVTISEFPGRQTLLVRVSTGRSKILVILCLLAGRQMRR